MNRSTEANIQRKAAQPWLAGMYFPGTYELTATPNRLEESNAGFGTEEYQVNLRETNSQMSIGAVNAQAEDRIARAICGYDPRIINAAQMLTTKYRRDLPGIVNVLNDDGTKYRKSYYYGAVSLSPNPPLTGAPNDFWKATFTGVSDRPAEIFQDAWLFTEKRALTPTSGTYTATLTTGSVQPAGSNAYGVDTWIVIDPPTGYEPTEPSVIVKVPGGPACFGTNGKTITIVPEQIALLPDTVLDMIATGSTLNVLAVCLSTTSGARSDSNWTLPIAVQSAWDPAETP